MIEYRWRGTFHDDELNTLHAKGFGEGEPVAWNERLQRWSLGWVCAREGTTLVGFVNVISDGGRHAFLLDTVVDPRYQRNGVGRYLVESAASAALRLGCEWLHVDFEPHLAGFYREACGFSATEAGVRRLTWAPAENRGSEHDVAGGDG